VDLTPSGVEAHSSLLSSTPPAHLSNKPSALKHRPMPLIRTDSEIVLPAPFQVSTGGDSQIFIGKPNDYAKLAQQQAEERKRGRSEVDDDEVAIKSPKRIRRGREKLAPGTNQNSDASEVIAGGSRTLSSRGEDAIRQPSGRSTSNKYANLNRGALIPIANAPQQCMLTRRG
jgi:hypothetical protein